MNIVVIDREALTNQLIASKLGAKGHFVVAEPNKNAAFDMIRDGVDDKIIDCIMVDPAPLAEARPVIIGIWKNIRTEIKPYIFLLSKTATTEDAILAGTNDVVNKPLSSFELETRIGNAERLLEICQHLSFEDDVHSGGGMIGKSAFHQLFLSATDRAFRYGERSLIVFLEVTNYDEMLTAVGADALNESLKKLSEKMTFMRRQSDVIGRISDRGYGILLQRPQYETEPLDAINRFSEVLDKFHQSIADKNAAPCVHLTLVELPQGAKHAERSVPLQNAIEAEGGGA